MVRFVPMSEAEFAAYLEHAVPEYAQAHLKSGDVQADEALTLAQADYQSLLPLGLATEGQHFFTVHADGEPGAVGMIWFSARERPGKDSAYIYDIRVREELRGRGYGTATLHALEQMLADMKIGRVGLYVMGWNTGARALYERQGYAVTGIGMHKVLESPVATTIKA